MNLGYCHWLLVELEVVEGWSELEIEVMEVPKVGEQGQRMAVEEEGAEELARMKVQVEELARIKGQVEELARMKVQVKLARTRRVVELAQRKRVVVERLEPRVFARSEAVQVVSFQLVVEVLAWKDSILQNLWRKSK